MGRNGLISEVKRGLFAQQAQAPLRNHECPAICLVCCGAGLRATAAVVITPQSLVDVMPSGESPVCRPLDVLVPLLVVLLACSCRHAQQ